MDFSEFKIKNITRNCAKGGVNYLYFFELEEVIRVDGNDISQVGVEADTNVLNNDTLEEEMLIKGGYVNITNVKKTPYVQDYRIIGTNPAKTLIIERNCRIDVDLRGIAKIVWHIENGFNFHTDLNRDLFVCPADGYSVGRGVINNEELETITDTIVNYISHHQGEFSLKGDRLTYNAYGLGEEQAGRMRYIEKGTGAQHRCLFPRFFSEQQYERIKNALGDNVSCKVPGCYNNYAGTRNYNEIDEVSVINGRCGYHRRMENGDLPLPNQEPEDQTAGAGISEHERKRIIRNALNNNNELKRMLEANPHVSEDFFKLKNFTEKWVEQFLNQNKPLMKYEPASLQFHRCALISYAKFKK
ncbi:4745_t:CDS:2, partial [Funneliformis geosporum]